MFQHTFYEVHKKRDFNPLSSDVVTDFQQAINSPLYQEELSGAVNIDISKSSHQHCQAADHSDCQSSSPHDDQHKAEDTCSKESCDKTEQRKQTSSDNNVQLKILSFNIWNTNVVRGGYKEYISRIKQIAKACEVFIFVLETVTSAYQFECQYDLKSASQSKQCGTT